MIPPKTTVEFGCQCSPGMMGPTSATVDYAAEDGGVLKFYWINPLTR